MSTALRRLILTTIGLLAGIAAWPLMELILSLQQAFPSYFIFSLAQGALFGLVMGAFFGSGEGLTSKEGRKILRGTLTGAAAGTTGGILGFLAGQGILLLVLRHSTASYSTQQLLVLPSARIVGWVILGVAIGLAEGLRARSMKKSLVGASGGLAAGLIGGGAIEYLGSYYPHLLFTRLIGLSLFGLLIGLFYSLLEKRVSLGILRILNGARRGKEYSFAQNKMSVGSGERNDIVLGAYEGVEKRHALFRVRGKDVYVQRESPKAELLVNEEPVETERLLKYEDVLQLGSAKLWYKTE